MATYRRKRKKSESFFVKCALLLRCFFSSAAFATIWVGAMIVPDTVGTVLMIIGICASLISIFTGIISPLKRIRH